MGVAFSLASLKGSLVSFETSQTIPHVALAVTVAVHHLLERKKMILNCLYLSDGDCFVTFFQSD